MSYPDLDEARRHHGALKEILREHGGGKENRDAVRQVQEICRAASAAVDDAYCRETLGIVGDYAWQLLSVRKHLKADFLRLQIAQALDALDSRLSSLEAIRRAGESLANAAHLQDRHEPRIP
jgi:hypothetical protein